MNKHKIIAITDGDSTAAQAVQQAGQELELEVIYESAGNPTSSSGTEIKNKIKETTTNPVLVMFDDQGELGTGLGEQALLTVISDPDIEVLGVLAVASNLKNVQGVNPNFSITQDQEIISEPVDKNGKAEELGHDTLEGDTIDVLNKLSETLIIGIGDLGKMEGKDIIDKGAPITTKAISEVLKRSDAIYEY